MSGFHCSFSAAQSSKQIILTPSPKPLSVTFFFQLHIGVFINFSFPSNLWKKETQNKNYQITLITVSPHIE